MYVSCHDNTESGKDNTQKHQVWEQWDLLVPSQ